MIECKRIDLYIDGGNYSKAAIKIDGEIVGNVRSVSISARVLEMPVVVIELSPQVVTVKGQAMIQTSNAESK